MVRWQSQQQCSGKAGTEQLQQQEHSYIKQVAQKQRLQMNNDSTAKMAAAMVPVLLSNAAASTGAPTGTLLCCLTRSAHLHHCHQLLSSFPSPAKALQHLHRMHRLCTSRRPPLLQPGIRRSFHCLQTICSLLFLHRCALSYSHIDTAANVFTAAYQDAQSRCWQGGARPSLHQHWKALW
jgi:hypothetical protein